MIYVIDKAGALRLSAGGLFWRSIDGGDDLGFDRLGIVRCKFFRRQLAIAIVVSAF